MGLRERCFFARSGSSTLPRTVSHGISERPYSWKTIATSGGGPSTSSPRRRTSPRVGSSSPARHLSSVVLPQPDCPTTQTNSFPATEKVTSPIASTASRPLP
jgi:hypothetical protein